MKELVKPNEQERENPELDYYCETKNVCGRRNDSLEEDDEIIF